MPTRVILTETARGDIRAEMARQHRWQRDIAAHLGVSQSWVSRVLAGIRPVDRVDVFRIATFLGLPTSVPLGWLHDDGKGS